MGISLNSLGVLAMSLVLILVFTLVMFLGYGGIYTYITPYLLGLSSSSSA
jgi:predicted MFS family arabinose efflux permease